MFAHSLKKQQMFVLWTFKVYHRLPTSRATTPTHHHHHPTPTHTHTSHFKFTQAPKKRRNQWFMLFAGNIQTIVVTFFSKSH